MTTQEIYDTTIRPLTTSERLRLATLILNDLPPQSIVDYSENWSDEDIKDFVRSGLSAGVVAPEPRDIPLEQINAWIKEDQEDMRKLTEGK